MEINYQNQKMRMEAFLNAAIATRRTKEEETIQGFTKYLQLCEQAKIKPDERILKIFSVAAVQHSTQRVNGLDSREPQI